MGDLSKHMIFGFNGGVAKRKCLVFWLNGGLAKTCDFRLNVGFLNRKCVFFCVNWGICKEKMRDFRLNGGFEIGRASCRERV